MLHDLGITSYHTDINKIIKNLSQIYSVIHKPYFRYILTIFDKLMMRNIITNVLNSHTTPPQTSNNNIRIMNHSLSTMGLIKLYARTNAYDLIYYCGDLIATIEQINRDKVIEERCGNELVQFQLVNRAIRNGLRIDDMIINNITDYDMTLFTSLKKLEIGGDMSMMTCDPFAKSLRELKFSGYGYNIICDDGLRNCVAIEVLDLTYNICITTCAPFAASLRKLVARGSECMMCDAGLRSCVHIVELDASSNTHITTCAPFATSLRKLVVHGANGGIRDAGLCLCTRIVELDACANPHITTCAPFATSLKICDASWSYCGISDNSLFGCTSIEKLNASNNNKITTCVPFAKSLKILYAAGYGICDEDVVYKNYNMRTTCKLAYDFRFK